MGRLNNDKLQSSPEQMINRRDRIVLLHQINKYKDEHPSSIKKFLDLNIHNINQLLQIYVKAGQSDLATHLKDELEKLEELLCHQKINTNVSKESSTTARLLDDIGSSEGFIMNKQAELVDKKNALPAAHIQYEISDQAIKGNKCSEGQASDVKKYTK